MTEAEKKIIENNFDYMREVISNIRLPINVGDTTVGETTLREGDVFRLATALINEGFRLERIGTWTGVTSRDYAHAEGLPSYATPEERKAYLDMFSHITHCSVCGVMFDNRQVKHWKYCPHCGARITNE
jgi:predicted Zn-ribbon and HTH transcriptional regulator